MYKKFFDKYGWNILATIVFIGVFAIGFVFGRYAKAAPSIEVIEQAYMVIPEKETTKAEQEEPPAVEYTELRVTATAYCACENCCGKTDGITATGTKATAGRTIAVDPSVIQYGTEVIVNGNTYVAEDTGGLIKGNRIDIYFDSHNEALEYGVQEVTALIKK